MSDRIDFIDAYVEAALWSSTDDDGEPLDKNYDAEDIDNDTAARMEKDAADFYDVNEELLFEDGNSAADGGHNFWLTRNGHGAGFWDGDYPEEGDNLTDNAKNWGEYDLYVGDDGTLYGYPP